MRKSIVVLLGIMINFNFCLAQWSTNPAINNMICGDAPNIGQNIGNYHYFRMINDGSGGAYCCWFDQRNTNPLGGMDVILQHISSAGVITWPANGLTVCNADYNQRFPEMTNDGSGGVVITWDSDIDGKVYAQRVDANGNLLWGTAGVVVCNYASSQHYPNIIRNENGEVTIVWKDSRGVNGYALYAQRLDMNGNLLWSADGMELTGDAAMTSGVVPAKLISDGNNGIIACWDDIRTPVRVYAQRMLMNGTVAWTANGVMICDQSSGMCSITTDGNGGAIIAWVDNRNPFITKHDIYAQHIDAGGNLLWTVSGTAICTEAENQEFPQITSDNNNGAIISWQDDRAWPNNQVYVQRINSTGTTLWTSGGVLTGGNNNPYSYIKMTADQAGGAVIVWGTSEHIRAQRVSPTGAILFPANGAMICTNPSSSPSFPEIISIGSGNTIAAWLDFRNPGLNGIYASRILANGTLPVNLVDFYGKKETGWNQLYWTTNNEQNNAGFDIERSMDGINFQKIGFIAGQVNSSTTQHYSFKDLQPFNGKNYYRLKQKDIDNNFRYSKIILLDNNEAGTLTIFPNPAGSTITIQMDRVGPIQIIDVSGKLVKTVAASGNSIIADISHLPPGIYYARSGNEIASFIRQ